MAIAYKPAQLIGGLLVALVGFCFVFWPPGLLGESVLYAIGPLLLAAGSVVAAIQFSVRPRTGMEEAAAPADRGAHGRLRRDVAAADVLGQEGRRHVEENVRVQIHKATK